MQRVCGRQKFLMARGQSRSRGQAHVSPVATLDFYCNIPEAVERWNVNF